MSNFFGLIKHGPKAGKYVMETLVPKISKNLTKLRKIKDEGFKAVDDQTKGTNVSNQKKSEIKKSFSKKVSNIIEKKAKGGRIGYRKGTPGKAMEKKGIPIIIVTKSGEQKMEKLPLTENKAKGGRIGYRKGTSKNVQKIKKTFGPKSLGMQSIIYGLDKNPNITKADPKAKFIAAANKKKKKKVI